MKIDPLSVTCPLCSTQPGNKCVNGNFLELSGPHPERQRLAEAVANYKVREAERKALRDSKP